MTTATGALSLGQPTGPRKSRCGYCSPLSRIFVPDTNVQSAGLDSLQLTCDVYQKMIDRGWRRSGTWCYKSWLEKSCCPQYTIRLDALAFSPSRGQRKPLYRWNRFITLGEADTQDDPMQTKTSSSSQQKAPEKPQIRTGRGKGKLTPFSFVDTVHEAERDFMLGPSSSSVATSTEAAHVFEVRIEPSSLTQEKFQLYDKYQRGVHDDFGNTPHSFKRFLVDSPLIRDPIPYPTSAPAPAHLPTHYGSYHQLYRVDGQLIAMAVLDILPSCVSSVYFMYDPDWDRFSLGKISALREIALARELFEAGIKNLKYLYMGFYIHSCQKMRYKGEYAPSFLADPETYTWYPLETCRPLLDNHRYACFSHPEYSRADHVGADERKAAEDSPAPPLPDTVLAKARVATGALKWDSIRNGTIMSELLIDTPIWSEEEERRAFAHCMFALGEEVMNEVILRA